MVPSQTFTLTLYHTEWRTSKYLYQGFHPIKPQAPTLITCHPTSRQQTWRFSLCKGPASSVRLSTRNRSSGRLSTRNRSQHRNSCSMNGPYPVYRSTGVESCRGGLCWEDRVIAIQAVTGRNRPCVVKGRVGVFVTWNGGSDPKIQTGRFRPKHPQF